VAFTGSRGGGLALARLAAARAEPIPVYAEMSSINPVILFPTAARARGAELGQAFVSSLTLGAGQFCTNPGLVLALGDEEPQAFIHSAAESLRASAAQQMLSVGIHAAYDQGTNVLSRHPSVKTIARGGATPGATAGQAGIFTTEAAAFLADKALGHEVFGPASLIVRVRNDGELLRVLREIEGQLTATLLFDLADEAAVAGLLPVLQQKVGRILANGWPTGVEVCHAMVHGGPFPATTDARSTSVGSLAMQRFLRPVCFQNMPETLLPNAVRDSNPYQLPRTLDGVLTLAG
jgi:NADP-dependent aldehyde dehydrogenase